jgi:hypothetical protein
MDRSVVIKRGRDCGRHLNNSKSSCDDESSMDPTELDVTETERINESFDFSASFPPLVVKAGPLLAKSSRSSSSLMPLSDLVERLARVNQEETPSKSRQIASRASPTMTIEEMTRLLTNINLDEATLPHVVHKLYQDDDNSSTTTSESAKREQSMVSFLGSSHVVSDDEDFDEESSLRLDDLHHMADDNMDNGFSLDLTNMTCASSVTWLEGSDGEEETICSEDDEEDFKETLLLARGLSTGSFDDASIASATSSIFSDPFLLPGRTK